MSEEFTFDQFVSNIRARLAKDPPDYAGITSELQGAQRMALIFASEQTVSAISDLYHEVIEAWQEATTDDKRFDTVQRVIETYGAIAVYQAAQEACENSDALRDMGVKPCTPGDAWQAMSTAYDAMNKEQRRQVDAHNNAALETHRGG